MTTKTFSQSKMGRNPFAPKPAAPAASSTKSASHVLKTAPLHHEPRPKSYERRDYETMDGDSVLLALLAFPLRSMVFGLKSLMVARYLFAHPREWRF